MDGVALEILHEGLKQDAAIVAQAASRARERLAENHPGSREACGFELHRLYNVLEKSFERVCEAFENHFEKRGDYHEKLIQRLTLDLEGIRPRFIPKNRIQGVRELKGFRHVTRHAYDLVLKEDRLAELVGTADEVAAELPAWRIEFGQKVRAEQGW